MRMSTPTNVTVNLRTPGRAAQRLEVAARVIMLAYTALMAWQVAKVVCPPLAVHERLLIERMQRRFAKPRELSRQEADEFIADVTSFVRKHEEE